MSRPRRPPRLTWREVPSGEPGMRQIHILRGKRVVMRWGTTRSDAEIEAEIRRFNERLANAANDKLYNYHY